jgi:hypothetical protein
MYYAYYSFKTAHILINYVLFKDTASSSSCIAHCAKVITEWCIGEDGEESTRGSICDHLPILQLPEGAEKDHENPQSRRSTSLSKFEKVFPKFKLEIFSLPSLNAY